MAVGGGPVIEVADIGGNPRGATWAPDGTIVVAPTQTAGLMRVPDRGGAPVALTTLDKARDEYSHRWPDAVPGTRWVLFTVGTEDGTFDEGRIEAVSLETGSGAWCSPEPGSPATCPAIASSSSAAAWCTPSDSIGRLSPCAARPKCSWMRFATTGGTAAATWPCRPSGVLVYGPGQPISHEYYLSWVGRDGRFQRATDTPRRFRDLDRSPDGGRIAVVVGTSTESDLWAVDANGTLARLSIGLSPYRPTWTADGRGVTVGAKKDGKWRLLTIPADGSGEPVVAAREREPAASGRVVSRRPSSPLPGEQPLDGMGSPQSGGRRRRTPVGARKPFAASPFHESTAAISADGRWVAYESDELDGVVQIYVRSWPDGAHKVQASNGGGRLPAWGPGGELYYWQTGENMLRVMRTRETGGQLTFGTAEPVWQGDVAAAVAQRLLDHRAERALRHRSARDALPGPREDDSGFRARSEIADRGVRIERRPLTMPSRREALVTGAALVAGPFMRGPTSAAQAQGGPQASGATGWGSYGGDKASSKSSPLAQIGPDNFNRLKVAWQWRSTDHAVLDANPQLSTWVWEATPLMVDGVLYVSTSLSQVAAIEAATGKTRWIHDPGTWKGGTPSNNGFVHRGVRLLVRRERSTHPVRLRRRVSDSLERRDRQARLHVRPGRSHRPDAGPGTPGRPAPLRRSPRRRWSAVTSW